VTPPSDPESHYPIALRHALTTSAILDRAESIIYAERAQVVLDAIAPRGDLHIDVSAQTMARDMPAELRQEVRATIDADIAWLRAALSADGAALPRADAE